MGQHDSTGNEGDRPQWLGSLVRRGKQVAAPTEEPVFAEGEAGPWLGSVARRQGGVVAAPDPVPAPVVADAETDAPAPSAGEWNGSAVRSAVFAVPDRRSEPEHAQQTVRELPQDVVMGALGMTLRVAA